jgi:hypothetical protein
VTALWEMNVHFGLAFSMMECGHGQNQEFRTHFAALIFVM